MHAPIVGGAAVLCNRVGEPLASGMGQRFREVDLYDHPHYYDIVFDEGSAEEADFVEAIHHRYGRTGQELRVLEPACGTGRLVIELANRGFTCHGFDASEPMLDYARQRAKARGEESKMPVSFSRQRMEDFECPLRRITLVVSLISSFKYLLTEAQALSHLRGVAETLAPGGLFVLGLHLTDYSRSHAVHERWVATRGALEVICNTRTWPADRRRRRERVRNRLTIVEAVQEDVRRHESVWEFRTYDALQLRRILHKVGNLNLVAAFDFSYDLDAPRKLDDSQEDIVLVLRKGEDA